MTLSFFPKDAFPLPAPLTTTLLDLGMDNKTALKASKIYHSAALTLKEACEREYTHACSAIIATSDDRGHSSKDLRSKLLTVAIARYTQAVWKWKEETINKAKASLLRRNKPTAAQPKVKYTPPPKQSHRDKCEPSESFRHPKHAPFSTDSPPHAFPRAYPPQVPPEPISFVTHIPVLVKGSRRERRAISTSDLDTCIDAFSRLSLGSISPLTSPQPSKTPKPRPCPHGTSKRSTFRLSPSRPRLVSPMLDTSFAIFQTSTPRSVTPAVAHRTQNIDIPRSNRRMACSIPYRRPATRPPTSPESSPSFSPHSICRTPSLASDHGSEASSPSTPPDIPTSALPCKDPFEPMSLLEQFLAPYPGSEWQDINYETDLYG